MDRFSVLHQWRKNCRHVSPPYSWYSRTSCQCSFKEVIQLHHMCKKMKHMKWHICCRLFSWQGNTSSSETSDVTIPGRHRGLGATSNVNSIGLLFLYRWAIFFSAAMMQGEFWQCNPYYRAGLISHILVSLQVRGCALSSWYSSTALVLILSVIVPCCILPHCVIVEIREVCVNIALCTNFVIESAHTLTDFVKYKLCVDDGDAIRCGNRVPYDASIFRVAPLVLL